MAKCVINVNNKVKRKGRRDAVWLLDDGGSLFLDDGSLFLDDGSLFLDGAVPGTVDAIVLEQELAIDHRGAAVVAAEARRVRVPVHFPVANARLIGPDRSAALVAVLQQKKKKK